MSNCLLCNKDSPHFVNEIFISFFSQGGAGKKKHGRYEDYVDLGAGYDETDPFIDNTDAVSRNIPPVEVLTRL
jgi:hypothetical protein